MILRLKRENFGIFRTDRANFAIIQRFFYRGVEKRINFLFERKSFWRISDNFRSFFSTQCNFMKTREIFFSKINIQPFETFPFPVFCSTYSIFSSRIERDIFIKFLSGYFHLKKKKKYQKNEFHLSGIFRNISLGRIIFFFRTNFLSQPQHGGFAKGEESNIIFREKWASQADYLGILVELKLFPLLSRHFIAFIFFEIYIFLLKMERNGIIISIISSFILV